jgi:hypothetical protein
MSIHSMSKGFPSPGYKREVTQFQWIKLDIIELEFIELIYSIVRWVLYNVTTTDHPVISGL